MFQQSAANLNFFPYRLHNEMLDKKINSTHDCQDYYNSFAVEISRNFTTSAYTEHTQHTQHTQDFEFPQSAWQ